MDHLNEHLGVPQNKLLLSKLSIALILAIPTIGFADPIACNISPLAQYIMPESGISKSQLIANADDGYLTDTEGLIEGNAEVLLGDDRMTSDYFTLDRINQIVKSSSDQVRYSTPNTVLEGKKAIHLITENETHISDAHYFFKSEPNSQGRASQIDHLGNLQNTLLKNATYSTCIVDNEIWKVQAKDIDINHAAGRAKAYHATLDVFGVPVLYSPYMSFPIDGKRHSGLLFPELSISKSDGVSFFIPYYFNIAPNMDAILAPGFINRRGIGIKGNFRYLNNWQESEISGTYLFKDRLYDHKKRWIIRGKQELGFTDNLTGNILYQNVSDNDYLHDIEDQTGILEETSLERHAALNYRTENWEMKIRFQDFIVVDPSIVKNNPYSLAPQLLINRNWDTHGFDIDIYAEISRFQAKDNERLEKNKPYGATRIDIMPSISYRLENSWGFIEPKARFRFTQYNLSYNKHNRPSGQKTSFSRALPILSIDTGIYLDRETKLKSLFGGGNFLQTIEPRLFYLYAPYREQSNIPLFDTSQVTSSFNSLFNFNDFYGADRQSNANQLTMALTTRLINDKTGVEKFYISMGQTQYFTSPRTTLGKDLDENSDTIHRSSFFTQAGMEILPKLNVNGTLVWTPKTEKKASRANINISYKPSDRKMFNIGYRYSRNFAASNSRDTKVDQIDTSFFWQLNNRWAVAGRYNYGLSESKMVDSQLGVEFKDCCVTTRVSTRYYRTKISDREKQWRVYLEFELDGMGNVGQNIEKMWEKSISGFSSRSRKFF